MVNVDIWVVHASENIWALRSCKRSLSNTELLRASAFRFERDRNRFILFRGALRFLLGRELSRAPNALRIVEGPFGKPRLQDESGNTLIHFNVSHSAGVAVIALCRDVELGVDIEPIRPLERMDGLARRLLAERELKSFEECAPLSRGLTLLRVWTRKEAYLKGTGEGLSHPLQDIEVTLGDVPSLRSVRRRPTDPAIWTLYEFWPSSDMLGTLALVAQDARLSVRVFSFPNG